MKKLLFTFYLWTVSFHQALAAQTSSGNTGSGSQTSSGNYGNSSNSGSGQSVFLQNPLKTDSIVDLFSSILDIIMVLATPIIVIFIILAGFKYVTAQGDSSKIKEAHNSLMNAVIGGVLILGAKLIMEIIKNTIDAF